jgi:hypothetical protein
MVITVPVLKSHIDRMNNGFSLCELNTRADLVRFEGFTLEKACSISEDDAYNVFDRDDSCDMPLRLVPIPCSCGHHEVYEKDYSDYNDCYTLECPKCKKETSIHYTGYDSILEGIEFVNSMNSEMKEITNSSKCHYMTREVTPEQLKQNGRVIQDFSSINDQVYYQYDNKYYVLDTLHKSIHVIK